MCQASRYLAIGLVTILLAGSAAAEDEADQIRRLQEQVVELTESVEELQNNFDDDDDSEAEDLESYADDEGWAVPRIKLSIFGDVGYSARWRNPDSGVNEETNSFELGNLALFLSANLSDRVRVFNEIVFETEHGGVHVDLERVVASIRLHDQIQVHAGRGHTALSYWNQTFHHGSYLQTTIATPLILGSLLPRHYVGAEFEAKHIFRTGVATLSLEVANGRGQTQGAEQNIDDLNQGKMVSAVFAYEPATIAGLGIIAGYTWDEIPGDDTVPARIDGFEEQIASFSINYNHHAWELIAEGHVVWHDDKTDSRLKRSHGGYAQLSRRCGAITPYYRFDWLGIDARDDFYSRSDTEIHTFGTRWDFAPYTAFKAEYRHTRRSAADDHSAHLNVSFGF